MANKTLIEPGHFEKAPSFLLLAWFLVVLAAYFCIHAVSPVPLNNILTSPGHAEGYSSYLLKITTGLGVALWILWSAHGVGQWLLDSLSDRFSMTKSEALLFSSVAGLGILAYAVFLLGCLKIWYVGSFLSLLLLVSLRQFKTSSPSNSKSSIASLYKGGEIWVWILGAFLTVILLADLAPEIFYDSLYYHLAVPNLYRLAHCIYAMPTLLFSNFIYSLHMLYGLAITIGNTLTAKLLHGAMAVFLALAYLAFGKRYLSNEAGILSAVLFLSIPIVGMNAATAGIDVGAALIQFTAGYALVRALTESNRSWFGFAGFLTGLAASCKLPAWSMLVLALVVIAWHSRHFEGKTFSRREVLIFLVPAVIPPAIFWMRNWVFHGNPLYPIGGTFWGHPLLSSSQWQTFVSDANVRVLINNFSDWPSFWRFLIHPWVITMEGHTNGDFVGPMVLMSLPALLIIRRVSAPARLLALYGALGWLIWLFTSTMPRYGLPALSMILPAIAEGIVRITRPLKAKKWIILWPLVLAAGINFASLSYNLYAKGGWQVIDGQISEADYLGAEHPSYPTPPYAAISWMNQNLHPNEGILFIGDPRTYYSDRRCVAGSVPDIQPLVANLRNSHNAKELANQLREQGISDLFFNQAEALRTQSYNLFPWTLEEWIRLDDFWKRYVVLTWKKEGDDQALYVYRLLSDEEAAKSHSPAPNPFEPWRPQR